MRWSYDPWADALYFGFIANRKSAGSTQPVPDVILDYDDAGNPIGVELLNARKHVPEGALIALPLPGGERYSLIEAARRIGLDPATLRQQILKKRIRATKYYRQWWVEQSALDEYLNSRAPQGRRSRKKVAASRQEPPTARGLAITRKKKMPSTNPR
jgi:uncharacterized protein YuzE